MPSANILGFQHPLDVRVELPEMQRPDAAAPTIEATPEQTTLNLRPSRRAGGSGS
jgi:hypothetical protein